MLSFRDRIRRRSGRAFADRALVLVLLGFAWSVLMPQGRPLASDEDFFESVILDPQPYPPEADGISMPSHAVGDYYFVSGAFPAVGEDGDSGPDSPGEGLIVHAWGTPTFVVGTGQPVLSIWNFLGPWWSIFWFF